MQNTILFQIVLIEIIPIHSDNDVVHCKMDIISISLPFQIIQ